MDLAEIQELIKTLGSGGIVALVYVFARLHSDIKKLVDDNRQQTQDIKDLRDRVVKLEYKAGEN